MRIDVLATSMGDELEHALTADSNLEVEHIEVHDSEQALIAAVTADRPNLVIIESDDPAPLINRLRETDDEVAVLAIAEPDALPRARQAGADDSLARSELNEPSIARAVRYACERRRAQYDELRLLASVRNFGESLTGEEEIEAVVNRVLDHVVARTGAEIGFLVCEWEYKGQVDQVAALHGAQVDHATLQSLIRHPVVSPLHAPVGRTAVTPEQLGDASEHLGPIASLMVVPVARSADWGRGGIVLAHQRAGAFSARHVRFATGLAAWAGVAIMHAGVVRERNRAVEVREQVLAVASHDLRNPLSVFNMAIDLLADCDRRDERLEIIARARRAVRTMHRLITDLLDYAALDAGKLRIEVAPTDPLAIARRALDAVTHQAENKSIGLTLVGVDTDVASVEVDGGRIEQGLTNLLTNAVKFTPRKGRVQLTISQSKNHTTFTVTDTGPGISEDQQRMLFDRYYTSAMEHSGKGVGLGLAIARGIVASHAGSLLVESTPGEGSTFLLTVPNRQRADA